MTSKELIPEGQQFSEIVALIQDACQKSVQSVNQHLIDLYWNVGQYISHKLAQAEWGDGDISELAKYIKCTQPNLRGVSRPNLFRMRQFYDTYQAGEKVSPAVRQLSWTHNLIILNPCKSSGEREFHLRMAIQEKWNNSISKHQPKSLTSIRIKQL